MKRASIPKRRDRSSGQSPYAKYGKREYEYSQKYRDWHRANRASKKEA